MTDGYFLPYTELNWDGLILRLLTVVATCTWPGDGTGGQYFHRVVLMPGSHRTAVTILYAQVAFRVYGLGSDTVRHITVVKGVVRCEKLATIYTLYINCDKTNEITALFCSLPKVPWHIKYVHGCSVWTRHNKDNIGHVSPP